MTGSGKVLTGLMERRALEVAFQELAQTHDLDQLVESARQIAGHGSATVPVLVSLLDTDNPQLRGGLGQVAALLERTQIVPALRSAARARDRSDNARLTAMMILDRYLHEPVDDALLAGLQDSDAVAIQSLNELSHEMAQNPFVVIEYLNQLAEQPAEVADAVLDAIPHLDLDPHLITLLRMFAQGPHAGLAQKAIEQLSRNRSREAAGALAVLANTLPPGLAALAERGRRKLQLLGVFPPEPSDRAGWRALMSPVDGTGAQVIWFIGKAGENGQGTLFSILCKDPEGIIASFGSSEVPAADLPPDQEVGASYIIRQADDGLPITLLEAPLDTGRQAIREALDLHWARGTVPPMEYRLLSPLIWELGPVPPSIGDAHGSPEAPAPAERYDPAQGAALLDHPAFASWFWQSAPLYEAAGQLGWRPHLAERTAIITALLENHFRPPLVASFGRRLASMARWLALAEETSAAALAQAASTHLADLPPPQTPFLQRLVGSGLDVAVANLRSGFDWQRHLGEAA